MDTRMVFNIRGSKFETLKSTLSKSPGKLLNELDTGSEYYDPAKQEYFFDRDPEIFNSVLNMCNTGLLHIPKHICARLFRSEMMFWGVPSTKISTCCWATFFQEDEEAEVIEHLQETSKQINEMSQALKKDSLRYKFWITIENPESSLIAKMWFIFYMAVVVVSSITLCMWTMNRFRVEHYLSVYPPDTFAEFENSSEKWMRLMLTDPILPVLIIDAMCMVIFTLECAIHFVISPRKRLFIRRPINILTVIVIVVMWIGFVMEFTKEKMAASPSTRHFFFLCKALTMGRLLLFIRLGNLFRALRVLVKSIRASLFELLLMILTFAVAALIFGNMMFFVQLEGVDGKDDLFIWMWWAIITMTTVGYGDYVPTSTIGYVVGVFCAMCGVVILSMPIAVISSNFSAYYSLSRDKGRMAKMRKREMKSMKDITNQKNTNLEMKEDSS